MGVQGWTRWLADEGWIPERGSCGRRGGECNCCTSPWRDPRTMQRDEFGKRIVTLRSSSTTRTPVTLHLDGHGLAFHLYRVAYCRHVNRVVVAGQQAQKQRNGNNKNNNRHSSSLSSKNGSCCVSKKQLKGPDAVRRVIPTFLPLEELSAVTREYIEALTGAKHGFSCVVYWDGDMRRTFKQRTDEERRAQQLPEWSNLQAYCRYGAVTIPHHEIRCICQWESHFPKARLFVEQIRHVIDHMSYQCGQQQQPNISSMKTGRSPRRRGGGRGGTSVVLPSVRTVDCEEEADHIMARAASGDANAYVVANDSDFCFFPDVKYIPIETLDASPSSRVATAVVITRSELALSLNLPSEDSMTEIACIVGNDYVTSDLRAELDVGVKGPCCTLDEAIEFVAERGAGYRVGAKTPDCAEALHFVRTLYGLGDLTPFPLMERDSVNTSAAPQGVAGAAAGSDCRPKAPEDMDLKLAKIRPLQDTTVKDAVIRCLQAYVNQLSLTADDKEEDEERRAMIAQEHVDAFKQLDLTTSASASGGGPLPWELALEDPRWHPAWDDIPASYLVEKSIATCMALSRGSHAVRLSPPDAIFDLTKFHALLHVHRNNNNHLQLGASIAVPRTVPEAGQKREPPLESSSVTSGTDGQDEKAVLPIDEHEETILKAIAANRITIIQGETGCGKSSRIPVMILKTPPPDPALERVEMFISQPRRIAAKALVERVRSVEPEFKDAIALRMGHGVREYESSSTRAWFVTTGYLVRLLANHPERFDRVSHLIVDEVHERSVDTDILCFLCRRLLNRNPHIRLLLMSATLAASLYQEYFGVPEPPIQVGARRFPVKEVFLEDLKGFKLPQKETNMVESLIAECDRIRCMTGPSMSYMDKLYSLVAHLALVVGKPGSSVLVFVPGMNDIVVITELVEQLFIPGVRYTCFPIHSDIPFEDQMDVFEKSAEDEVKVIIATNAAESSVTLPEVDHVICLGLCKQVVYNAMSHRQMLLPAWISKASATQRAGRTGRLRPGTVYRMYTRDAYEHYMEEFEPGEMKRIPLDSVILMLKEMLTEDNVVSDVLRDCLEPPNLATIDRSFESLFDSHFITSPDDEGQVTDLGSFVSALGIDLSLGSLIGLGIQFGVAAEAIQMAAILSFPKTPWVISNPLIHEPRSFNEMTKKSFVSKCHFDANLFSEPLATMNLLWEYKRADNKQNWCRFYAVALPRIRRLAATSHNLRSRVADYVGIDDELLEVGAPPSHMPHSKVTVLRVLQAWVFHDTIIECPPRALQHGLPRENTTLSLGLRDGMQIEEDHLKQVLSPERHPYTLNGNVNIRQLGTFSLLRGEDFSMTPDFLIRFSERFLSFAVEREFDLMLYWTEGSLAVYAKEEIAAEISFGPHFSRLQEFDKVTLTVEKKTTGSRRGIAERACGMWKARDRNLDRPVDLGTETRTLVLWSGGNYWEGQKNKKKNSLIRLLSSCVGSISAVKSALSCDLTGNRKAGKSNGKFCFTLTGKCTKISETDLRDLLVDSSGIKAKEIVKADEQTITFHETPNSPHVRRKDRPDEMSVANCTHETSWNRPLIYPIPEGVRLLSVLASGRRREHLLRLDSRGGSDEEEEDDEENDHLEVRLNSGQTRIAGRWKRVGTDLTVYVSENSVPASALPVDASKPLYCCCANTMDVKGGGLRAEGLTLLPPGVPFYKLCRFSFGLDVQFLGDLEYREMTLLGVRQHYEEEANITEDEVEELVDGFEDRVLMAIDFNESTRSLGEELACFPDKVRELVSIFDGVDGYTAACWDVDSNPMTRENLEIFRSRQSTPQNKRPVEPIRTPSSPGQSRSGGRSSLVRSESGKDPRQGERPDFHSKQKADAATGKPGQEATKRRTKGKGRPRNKTNETTRAQTKRKPQVPATSVVAIDGEHEQDVPSDGSSDFELEMILAATRHLDEEPEGGSNLKEKGRKPKNQRSKKEKAAAAASQDQSDLDMVREPIINNENLGASGNINHPREPAPVPQSIALIRNFTEDLLDISDRLFVVDVPASHKVSADELPSTNILAMAVREARRAVGNDRSDRPMSINGKEWRLHSVLINGTEYFRATFETEDIPYATRKSDKFPLWMRRSNQSRPNNRREALACVPPPFSDRAPIESMKVARLNGDDTVVFLDQEMALRFEAAFWLERQLCTVSTHWFQRDLSKMTKQLQDLSLSKRSKKQVIKSRAKK